MKPDERRAETLLPAGRTPGPGQQPPPLPGDSINEIPLPLDLGPIRITEVLAKGGMGVTFLGRVVGGSAQQVVVKIPLTAETHLLERFKTEVRILSELNHPNIVRFIEAGESKIAFASGTRTAPWLAMEYVSGASLRTMLKQRPKADWKDVCVLLDHVLQALDHLHSRNLCHRDIKPDNLIHDPQTGNWKLVDFGIAKELIDNLRFTVTMVESNPGAWDYMSPEQSRGQHLDIRSDIYSIGLTAWEALIGEVPRPGATFPSAMLGPKCVPPDVDKLIAKMTAHRVEARYQSPAEALEALRVGAGVIEKKERLRSQSRRVFRRLAITTAAAAFAALTWVAGNQFETRQARDIVESVPQSDTQYTRICQKLARFRNEHSFWGRRYADDQYAKAEIRAADELQRMKTLFASLSAEVADPARADEYKFNRCEAFCKTFEEVYADATELKDMFTQRDIFDSKMVAAKAIALAAKGNPKEALDLLDQAKSRFSLPAVIALLTETRAHIAEGYAAGKVAEVAALLKSKSEQDWRQAQKTLVWVEHSVGPTPGIQSALKQADDLFWSAATNESDAAVSLNDLAAAVLPLDHYLDLSELKGHKVEALKTKEMLEYKIDEALYTLALANANAHLNQKEYALAAAEWDKYLKSAHLNAHLEEAAKAKAQARKLEDNNDWEIASHSAALNQKQHTFKLATDDYKNYVKKWPNGQYASQAREGMEDVVRQHFAFLKEVKNYDDFMEEFAKVNELYPGEQAQLQQARNWLVFHSHDEIWRLWSQVSQGTIQTNTALDRLSEINYRKCDHDKREYLDSLSEAMKLAIRNDTLETENYFTYLWQRPPSDCVKMSEAPTVYHVVIHSVDFSLSESLYKKFGGLSVQPSIRILFCRDKKASDYPQLSEIFKGPGAVDKHSFSVQVQKSLLYMKGAQIVEIMLDDGSWFGSKRLDWALLDNPTVGANSSCQWTFADGSTLTMRYTME